MRKVYNYTLLFTEHLNGVKLGIFGFPSPSRKMAIKW